MSDIPADYQDRLNIREQIARIDQAREQALKFTAEQHKLMAEEQKLASERHKLDRDRWLAPWLLLATVAASITSGVLVSVVAHFWR